MAADEAREPMLKLVVFVPVSHADAVRQAAHEAGAGRYPRYSHCSFSTRGVGRFRPLEGAQPAIGEVGRVEEVEEERIEMLCPRRLASAVVAAIQRAHPYEEVALDLYPLLDLAELEENSAPG